MLSHRREIEYLSGCRIQFYRAKQPLHSDTIAIGGWGYKDSANIARQRAEKEGLPYWAFEDAFVRSVQPGIAEPSASMLLDKTGIFYDARSESRLFDLIATGHTNAAQADNAKAIAAHLRDRSISKYNNVAPDALPEALKRLTEGSAIVIVDQTQGDASIPGALASPEHFQDMIQTALQETEGLPLIVKTHPDVMAGLKHGYIGTHWRDDRLIWLQDPVSPWRLFEKARAVFTVSSQLGMEALMAGVPVRCWGLPFYAGWGQTRDKTGKKNRARGDCLLSEIIHAAYLDYAHYFDHWKRTPIDVHEAIEQLAYLRGQQIETPRRSFSFLPRKAEQWVYRHFQRPHRP